ncbi:MAG: hypothetical protein J6U54_11650 [Clostridiales bacterium]|nr:hypothetical protein [Clostridiales bacterium]
MNPDKCNECRDKDNCRIRDLGLQWGCAKNDLLNKKDDTIIRLKQAVNSPEFLDAKDVKVLAEDTLLVISCMEKGWL